MVSSDDPEFVVLLVGCGADAAVELVTAVVI